MNLSLPMVLLAAGLILVVNLPFGHWRAGVRRFSPAWFAAVHLPVPLAIGVRWLLGLPFRWVTLPLFITAFFGGQWIGARWRAR